ncbi:MAG: hypothetical protein M3R20_05460 [Pseudomonadota bacterium]|nr:hypothetical protein [Pseudomonadota bacterium]
MVDNTKDETMFDWLQPVLAILAAAVVLLLYMVFANSDGVLFSLPSVIFSLAVVLGVLAIRARSRLRLAILLWLIFALRAGWFVAANLLE